MKFLIFRLKVLCIVIFVCVHNYFILFFFNAYVTKIYCTGTVIFEDMK